MSMRDHCLFCRNGILYTPIPRRKPSKSTVKRATSFSMTGTNKSMGRCNITYLVIPLWRGTHFASHFSPIRNHTATNTRSCDAHNHPVKHKYPCGPFFPSPDM